MALTMEEIETANDVNCAMAGWDRMASVPTREKLKALGLAGVVDLL